MYNTKKDFYANLSEVNSLTEEQLKKNIAKNISELRKASGLTQAQLAEKLSYSDKSVSKWERGDGVPDVVVMQKMAELFGVTLNDFISENTLKLPRKKPYLTHRIIIPILSVGLSFLVASVVFFILRLFDIWNEGSWLLFAYAVPVSFIALTVFTELWWNLLLRFLATSGIGWSIAICLKLTFWNVSDLNYLFIPVAILQVLGILWFVMRYRKKKRLEEQNKTDK